MTGAIVGEWARLLLGCLARAGVRHAVISPGSRSTPFAWAAATTPGLVCHALYDERSAAFFALGLSRLTAEPALLVCTSGSAAANYFPAIVEASLGRVPLLVLTADRPLEVQDAGAAQTIDQVKLYGDFARSFVDLGVPDEAPSALSALPRIIAHAVLTARSPEPGPVHLNARARKPLEPAAPHTEHERAFSAEVERLLARGVPRVFAETAAPDTAGIEALAKRLAASERTALVCGPLGLHEADDAELLVELARRLDAPLYAEATSQLRFGAKHDAALELDGYDWLLRAAPVNPELRPEVLLRFGATPVSAGVERLFAERGATELVLAVEHGLPDPTSSASLVVRGGLAATAKALLAALSEHAASAPQRAFRDALMRANDAAWRTVRGVLADSPFGEPQAVELAVAGIPSGGLLVVGNSLPVREVDAFVRASARRVSVLCQRGANGIDGVVSGAAGAAFVAARPTLLLVGDVSFAHDLSGLAAARGVETPFVIVVLDNGGGRIFEHLPAARLFRERPETSVFWLTPPELDLELAGRAFGLPYAETRNEAGLRAALAAAFTRRGASLVHVKVPPRSSKDAFTAITQRIGANEAG